MKKINQIEAFKLAHQIAKSIFEAGGDPGSPCTRIEFKGNGGLGENLPSQLEHSQGGYCLEALRDHIQRELKNFWNSK